MNWDAPYDDVFARRLALAGFWHEAQADRFMYLPPDAAPFALRRAAVVVRREARAAAGGALRRSRRRLSNLDLDLVLTSARYIYLFRRGDVLVAQAWIKFILLD